MAISRYDSVAMAQSLWVSKRKAIDDSLYSDDNILE